MPPIRCTLTAAIAFSTILASGIAAAHDGDLDPTFGTGGYTLVDFGATATAYGLAIAPDGKIVLGGVVDGGPSTGEDFAVARL
ncbi:hypothetical protein, partial [Dokdonella sp.]|uniref:hypothetical protein n=1 Tax=Dokdonella sp. TaxID=2291710 RepID=UPI002F429557